MSSRVRAAVLGVACTVALLAAPAAAARSHGLASRTTPTISSISITVVNQGEVTYATILGRHFESGATVSLGHGVTCAVQTVSATKLAVRLDVAPFATVGVRALSVTDPGGGTATLHGALRVEYAAILAKWAIGQGATAFATTLVRPTFTSSPTIAISGTGVTVAHESLGAGGTLELTFRVDRHAAATWRTMSVTEGLAAWTVQNGVRVRPAPTVTSVTPLGQGTVDQGVRIEGANFEVCGATEPTVSISGAGVTVDSVSTALGNLMYATLTVAPTAPLGPRDVTVTNCDTEGTATSTGAFSVLGLPSVSAVASLAVGVTRVEALVGSNLTPTTRFSVPGGGIAIDHLDYLSPQRIRATITVSDAAAVGPHDVTAVDAGGTPSTSSGVLTVDALPTEATVSPSGLGAGTTATLTVKGMGFRRRAAVELVQGATPDAGLTVGPTTWVSPTELQAKVTATQRATLATDQVLVVNLDGGTVATVGFHTNGAPVLTFASSATTAGSVVVTYSAPAGAPAGEPYDLRLCGSATLTKGCHTHDAVKSGTSYGGLTPGTRYYAQLTAPAGTGFYLATSPVVGPARATTRLTAPRIVSVVPSTTRAGAVAVTFTRPAHALTTQVYDATACRDRSTDKQCVTRYGVSSGSSIAGLVQGAGYHVAVTAAASPGYLAATSRLSGIVRATVQLGAPKVMAATVTRGTLRVTYRPAPYAARSQSYTLTACQNAALTKGCVVRQYYRSGKGVTGFGSTTTYVRITAVASVGYLAARSAVVVATLARPLRAVEPDKRLAARERRPDAAPVAARASRAARSRSAPRRGSRTASSSAVPPHARRQLDVAPTHRDELGEGVGAVALDRGEEAMVQHREGVDEPVGVRWRLERHARGGQPAVVGGEGRGEPPAAARGGGRRARP